MKKFISFILLSIFLVACGNSQNQNISHKSPTTASSTTASTSSSQSQTIQNTQTELFNLSNSNKTVPPDIMEQISWTGTGGAAPTCFSDDYSIGFQETEIEYTDYAIFAICGLKEQIQNIKITFNKPNNQSFTYYIDSEPTDYYSGNSYMAAFVYQIMLEDQTGTYSITAEFNNVSESRSFRVVSSNPRLYRIQNNIWLTNFSQNEEIRLFGYGIFDGDEPNKDFAKILGWKSYQVGSNGDLLISVSNANSIYSYFVVGEKTGTVYEYGSQLFVGCKKANSCFLDITSKEEDKPATSNTETGNWSPCNNTYDSQLHVGNIAHVSYDPPYANNVRNNPGLNNTSIKGKIQPGEKVEIISGPQCVNNWVWWKIESLETGLKGWTSEGDGEDYWLVPDN